MYISTAGKVNINKSMALNDGGLITPAYAFQSDTGTGFYRIGASQIGVSCGATNSFTISNSSITIPTYAIFSGTSYPQIQYNSANRLLIGETTSPGGAAETCCSFGSGSSSRNMVITLTKSTVRSGYIGQNGTALIIGNSATGSPIIFKNDMVYGSNDILASGTNLLQLGTNATFGIPAIFPDGTVSAPSISFSSNTTTGFYRSTDNTSYENIIYSINGSSGLVLEKNLLSSGDCFISILPRLTASSAGGDNGSIIFHSDSTSFITSIYGAAMTIANPGSIIINAGGSNLVTYSSGVQTTTGTVAATNFKCGSGTAFEIQRAGSVGGGSATGTITFSQAFSSTPMVVATMNSSSTVNIFTVQVHTITTSSFQYVKYYNNGSSINPAISETFSYIAMTS